MSNSYKLPEKFLSPYDPENVEEKIYQKWLHDGIFNPDVCIEKKYTAPNAPTFSIVLPPPNVTGVLHVGHAAMLAIEDTIVRYHRMKGDRTLWLPGTDHAAIATQTKVEKILQKEGLRKSDMTCEEFLARVDAFAQESHDTIKTQIEKMGASVDWSREAFTLDDVRQKAVYTAFKTMYDDGLIYRGEKIINWDPKGQTTVSDDEVIHEETKGSLYYFKYDANFPITIATTRPETKLGDTAVAVHPDDVRYKEFIDKTFDVNFVGTPLKIKVIADKEIDPEFGTGAVGITPAHSMTDFMIAENHGLPLKKIINEYAKIENIADEELLGKKTTVAREIIVERLEKTGLLEKTEEIKQNISKAERSGGIIEPLPKLQWFIDVNKKFRPKTGLRLRKTTLKKLMLNAVEKNGKNGIEILPKRFEKTYFHWINNLRDWCISRQIWYGHRIPVWYKGDELVVSETAPDNSGEWKQDEDTLDTWFSSGLWTFSTLGWPDKDADDLKTYHPTNLLETGYDILFFWVARMILMSTYFLGENPFRTVYLHGLVRDGNGRKMSKSLGNTLNPTELADKYGADAVRMSLMVGVGPGNDMNLSEEKIKAYKKFSNKIWNASRFVLENTADFDFEKNAKNPRAISLTKEDLARIDELSKIITDITDDIENYRLYLASEKMYHYFWHTFADIIIEESKKNLSNDDVVVRNSTQKMLYEILTKSLKVIHPFMPFVTEEIWQSLPQTDCESLMIASWPKPKK